MLNFFLAESAQWRFRKMTLFHIDLITSQYGVMNTILCPLLQNYQILDMLNNRL